MPRGSLRARGALTLAAGWVLFLCSPAGAHTSLVTRVAFGSCAHQNNELPILDAIVAARPDLFIFAGDNVYADTDDMLELRATYRKLADHANYQRLRAWCPILATWDDHDYGANDAGGEYVMKEESREVFLDFFQEPVDSPRRHHEGVYDAQTYGPPGRRVQILLLDTRYFRGPLLRREDRQPGEGRFRPNRDPSSTLLGEEQWTWLAAQLREPAEVRVIVSSIQLAAEEHAWEGWHQLPHERDRLFKLIDDAQAGGIVFVSGDRHHGELSRIVTPGGVPLYDLTSSGLSQLRPRTPEPNRHRIGETYFDINFGLIEMDWSADQPTLTLALCGRTGYRVLEHKIPLTELRPPGPRG